MNYQILQHAKNGQTQPIQIKKFLQTIKNGYYQGHTCLTLDMAYNNARLIVKSESTWLTL